MNTNQCKGGAYARRTAANRLTVVPAPAQQRRLGITGWALAVVVSCYSLVSTAVSASTGRVVLQFDDSKRSHYAAADTLDAYNLKGSFGVVSGFIAAGYSWILTPAMLMDMAARGHEIHDHTLNHDAAFWCASASQWGTATDQAQALLAGWGITTTGWNQPGGPGECFTAALRDTLLTRGYTYAAGRVGLTSDQFRNFHHPLRADPFSLGRGFVASWGYNAAIYTSGSDAEFDARMAALGPESGAPASMASAAAELAAIKRAVARGIAQGVTSIPLFHDTVAADSSLWALGRLCAWLVSLQPDVQVLRMAEAVAEAEAAPVPRADLAADAVTDRDGDGYPDGWVYVGPIRPDSVLTAGNNTSTTIYGPHPGDQCLRLRFDARVSLPGDAIAVQAFTTRLTGWEQYGTQEVDRWLPTTTQWQTFTVDLPVDPATDRVQLVFAGVSDSLLVRRLTVTDVLSPTAVRAPKPQHDHVLVIGPNPAGGLGAVAVLATDARVVGRDAVDVRGHKVALDNDTPAGVYFVRYQLADGCVLPRKVVVVR